MKQATVGVVASLLALTLLVNTSLAQGRPDFGKNEFDMSCASCHGVSGRGDGVLYRYLITAPSDLTTLAKRNGGVFPSQRVWDTIDGRSAIEIGPHGKREMPVWGFVYRSEAQDTQYQPDWYARNRMASLLDYLARIQEK